MGQPPIAGNEVVKLLVPRPTEYVSLDSIYTNPAEGVPYASDNNRSHILADVRIRNLFDRLNLANSNAGVAFVAKRIEQPPNIIFFEGSHTIPKRPMRIVMFNPIITERHFFHGLTLHDRAALW